MEGLESNSVLLLEKAQQRDLRREFPHLLLRDRPAPVLQIWRTCPDAAACASYGEVLLYPLPLL